MMTSGPFDGLDYLAIGGYTGDMDGHAPGLAVLTPPRSADEPPRLSYVAEAASPSWVLAHPTEPWLFTGGEAAPAVVTSYRWAEDGRLDELSRLSGGEQACHLALSADRDFLMAANYGSGSVSSFAVGADGTLSGPVDVLDFTGSGPDRERQDGPHAHQVLVIGSDGSRDSNQAGGAGELLVCDLGTDRIHRLRLDGEGHFHRAAAPIDLPPGTGPRHAVIVGDLLIVACELSSQLWVGRRDVRDDQAPDGDSDRDSDRGTAGDMDRETGGEDEGNERARESPGWTQIQLVPTAAPTTGPRQPSGIVTNGRTVIVATRGPDTITTFAVGADGVSRLAEVPSGGEWPRALTLRGNYLWVANQNDGIVAILDLTDPSAPTPVVQFAAPSVTCVVPVGEDAREIG